MPVADQEEGEEAGQLPEEDQQDQVARQDDAEHRAHECKQEREEARHRIGWGHVVAGVEHHQEADAGDQAGERPGKAVHPQGELKAEIRNPLCRETDDAAPNDLRVTRQHQDQADKSDCARQVRFCVAGIRPKKRRDTASGKGKRDDDDEKHFVRHRGSLAVL